MRGSSNCFAPMKFLNFQLTLAYASATNTKITLTLKVTNESFEISQYNPIRQIKKQIKECFFFQKLFTQNHQL